MTLVGKTEYTISIRITHSCMAGFFSTQITGEILRLIPGFLFYKKNSRRARECCLQWGNEEMLESGKKEVNIFPPPMAPSEKKSKVKNQRQHCFKKYLSPRLSQIDRLKVLNFKGFTDL